MNELFTIKKSLTFRAPLESLKILRLIESFDSRQMDHLNHHQMKLNVENRFMTEAINQLFRNQIPNNSVRIVHCLTGFDQWKKALNCVTFWTIKTCKQSLSIFVCFMYRVHATKKNPFFFWFSVRMRNFTCYGCVSEMIKSEKTNI